MELIVAVDRNWGIGNRGELLAHVRADMKHFREVTLGKTVILGAKTLKTFPGGRPLPKRTNLILSSRMTGDLPEAVVYRDLPSLLTAVSSLPPEETIVIGGASVYRQLLPYCSKAYVTVFDRAMEADAFFPDLSKTYGWKRTSCGPWALAEDENDFPPSVPYRFEIWEKKRVRSLPGKGR